MNLWNDIKAALGTKTGWAGLAYAALAPLQAGLKSDSADAIGAALKAFTIRDLVIGAAIVFGRAAIAKVAKSK